MLLLALTACDMSGGGPFARDDGVQTEYRPQEAGTVDHALCLLGFAHVPVRNVQPGHQLIEASINGVTGDFVLDTGANVTVVSTSQAERFAISARKGGVFGSGPASFAGSSGVARQVAVDAFEIGEIPIRQQRVLVADLDQLLDALGQVSGRQVSGVIGQDVLNQHRAIIDVSRPMLYLMEENRDPAPVPAEQCEAAA